MRIAAGTREGSAIGAACGAVNSVLGGDAKSGRRGPACAGRVAAIASEARTRRAVAPTTGSMEAAIGSRRVGGRCFSTRGLAKRPEQSFAELFEERNALYRKYSDLTVKCDGLTPEQVCAAIMAGVRGGQADE